MVQEGVIPVQTQAETRHWTSPMHSRTFFRGHIRMRTTATTGTPQERQRTQVCTPTFSTQTRNMLTPHLRLTHRGPRPKRGTYPRIVNRTTIMQTHMALKWYRQQSRQHIKKESLWVTQVPPRKEPAPPPRQETTKRRKFSRHQQGTPTPLSHDHQPSTSNSA